MKLKRKNQPGSEIMYKTQGSEYRHDLILIDWFKRLHRENPTHELRKKFIYPAGEVDVLEYYLEKRESLERDFSIIHFNNYEVKSNRHDYKAKQQLLRFEDYLRKRFKRDDKIINSFQVYGIDDRVYAVKHIDCNDGIEYIIGGGING